MKDELCPAQTSPAHQKGQGKPMKKVASGCVQTETREQVKP
jgi:hypothetical protein